MARHTTSVIEFREGGLLLKARGTHVIRVLGALKEVPFAAVPNGKDSMGNRTNQSVYDQYYAGNLKDPQSDPNENPFHPRVPTLFITHGGEPVFLKRDLE